MLVELLVGFYSNSLSLIGDAGHMFSDCASLVLGLVASSIALWDNNSKFTFVDQLYFLFLFFVFVCQQCFRITAGTATDEPG